jgi:hypothetical protein
MRTCHPDGAATQNLPVRRRRQRPRDPPHIDRSASATAACPHQGPGAAWTGAGSRMTAAVARRQSSPRRRTSCGCCREFIRPTKPGLTPRLRLRDSGSRVAAAPKLRDAQARSFGPRGVCCGTVRCAWASGGQAMALQRVMPMPHTSSLPPRSLRGKGWGWGAPARAPGHPDAPISGVYPPQRRRSRRLRMRDTSSGPTMGLLR